MNRVAFLAIVLAGTGAVAQTPPVKVRGTIVGLEGDVLTVKSKNGSEKNRALDSVTMAATEPLREVCARGARQRT